MASATRDDPLLTIGQVARQAGLNTSRIRFYERVGVLPEPERVAGQRRYRPEIVHRLAIVDVAQRAGLTLREIAPLTGPENRSADAGRHIRSLADRKLPDVDALIARAQAVKQWLQVARSCDCTSVDVCALFVDPTLLGARSARMSRSDHTRACSVSARYASAAASAARATSVHSNAS